MMSRRPVAVFLGGALVTAFVWLGAVAQPGSGATGTGHVATGTAARVPEVVISGFGYGHGRGMGQWGAFGYASKYGWSYQRILAHYYGGTSIGPLPSPEPDVTVHLVELDGLNTIAASYEGGYLVASWDGDHAAAAGAFEVVRSEGVQFIYSSQGCAGPWTEAGASTGPVTIASSAVTGQAAIPASVASSEVGACIPGVGERIYQGDLVAQPDGQTQDVVGLEDYVDGVVPAESPAGWARKGGEAALEAQAVAARSYALAYIAVDGQICDTTQCQMYLGWPDQYGQTADAAVSATNGEVLYCDAGSACGPAGSVALAEYSASTGGYSAGGAFPAVADLGDAVPGNPVHSWTVAVPTSDVEAAFPTIGELIAVEVTQRNGLGSAGGRAEVVTLVGSDGDRVVTGAGFAAALGLRSDWFTVSTVVSGLPGKVPPVPVPPVSVPPVSLPPVTVPPRGTPATTAPPGAGRTAPTLPVARAAPPVIGHPGPTKPIAGPSSREAGSSGPLGPDDGYWVADQEGDVSAFGAAGFYGAAAGTSLQGHVAAMAATPDYRGYWLAASTGAVLAFGDAHWYGSASDVHLRQPIFAVAATPDGHGYWLVSTDGGVFAYGDAPYLGSLAGFHLRQEVVAFAATPSGDGYWLATADGGVFAFGDASFYGSPAGEGLSEPITGMVAGAGGKGYLLFARDGGVFAYGDAAFLGSLPAERVKASVVAATGTSKGSGYYVLGRDGSVYAFGDAALPADLAPARPAGLAGAVAIVPYRSPAG